MAIEIPIGARFTFGVTATGNNGIPGMIWAQYPGSSKSHATVCVDDTANGNAGTVVRAFQCADDLADGWIASPNGQFVDNGECLTNSNGTATLEHCVANPGRASRQVWVAHGAPGKFGKVTSAYGDGCLTAKSMGRVDGSAVTVKHCVSGKLGQYWKAPGATRVYA